MLRLCNVSFYYTTYRLFSTYKKQVLRHVNLELTANSSLAIMGKSGSGKSTLAKIICGLLQPNIDENGALGEVKFYSKALQIDSLEARRRFYAEVQILFQDCIGSLNPHFTCLENCFEPLTYLTNCSKDEGMERIRALSSDLGLPTGVLDKQISSISGGEAQRICLIRALSIMPKILILDESLSGLDYELSTAVIGFLKRWQRQNNGSILLITHNENIAYALCDSVRILNDNGNLQE